MHTPRVSILMPVHNRDWCVGDAIASVMALELSDWELIVVDDGSTDATPERLRDAAHDPRVKLLHHPGRARRGIAASRNLAARAAKAPLLAFLDSDDLYLPHRFSAALSALDANPDWAACVEPYAVGDYRPHAPLERGEARTEFHLCRLAPGPGAWLRAMLFENLWWTTPCITLRRAAFEALGGFDERLELAEDTALWLRLAAACPLGVAQSDEAVAVVRRHQAHSWNPGALAQAQRRYQQVLQDLVAWANGAAQLGPDSVAIMRERLVQSLVEQLSDGSQPLAGRLKDAARAIQLAPALLGERRVWSNLLRAPTRQGAA